MSQTKRRLHGAIMIQAVTVLACGQRDSLVEPEGNRTTGVEAPAPSQAVNPVAVLVGAGDIAKCNNLNRAGLTANLLDHVSGTVFALGDRLPGWHGGRVREVLWTNVGTA